MAGDSERLLRLENENSSIAPKVERHEVAVLYITKEIEEIKATSIRVFDSINQIQSCVDTMPQKVGQTMNACREKVEADVKEHVKSTYARKDKALTPRHLYWIVFIVATTVSVVTWFNMKSDHGSNGDSVSAIIEGIQSGTITINPKTP